MTTSSCPANASILIRRATSAYNVSNFEQAIEHSRAALIMLAGLPDEEASQLLDEAYERLTMTYQRIGDLKMAQDVIVEWLSHTRREEGRIQAIIQKSRVESFKGQYDESIRLLEEAVRAAEASGYRRGAGLAMRIHADVLWKMGQSEEALRLGQSALAILEKEGDVEQQAATCVTMAAAYHHGGQFYWAIQYLQRAARIVEQLGRQFELAIVYSNLGETYAELYMMDRALAYHQKAVDLVGLERAHPDLVRNLGVDLIGVGRRDEGLAHLSSALTRARAINDPDLVGQVLYSLAEVDLSTGEYVRAEERSQELLSIGERLNSLRHRLRALMLMGKLARLRGDQVTAQVCFNECSMLAQRSVDRHAIWQTHAALHDLLKDSMPQMAEIHRRMAAEMMTNVLNGITDPELRRVFEHADPVRSVLGNRNRPAEARPPR